MLQLLFPKQCNGCQQHLLPGEEVLCVRCVHALPLVCHHRTNNPAMQNVFYGRLSLVAATALFRFQKRGVTQHIMHNLKYRGKQEISSFLGKWMGAELRNAEGFQTVDLVIPVPLHKKKLKQRGYNQVEGFGKEIANALTVAYRDDILLKTTHTQSQVSKQRVTRFSPSDTNEDIYTTATGQTLNSRHVLLVDDVVTTGATLENCAITILKSHNVLLSLATMAIA